jgi:predicted lipoprotein with Yx(FWY)xxD motif
MGGRRFAVAALMVAGVAGVGGCGAAGLGGAAFPGVAPSVAPTLNPAGPGAGAGLGGGPYPAPGAVSASTPLSTLGPGAPEPGAPEPGAPGAGASGAGAAPAPFPTVAKVQKWVKIFSGPSATDLAPPANRDAAHTIELNATPSAAIGTYVADGAGRTLYRFDSDPARKSVCNGDCAIAWPPLLIKSPGKIFPNGIDPRRIGYIERADHHCQVTIDGHPLYYFVADGKAGDINGQGINGKWFAISPDGGRTRPIAGFPPGR